MNSKSESKSNTMSMLSQNQNNATLQFDFARGDFSIKAVKAVRELIEENSKMGAEWHLVPVKDKSPHINGTDWQHYKYFKRDITIAKADKGANGIGLIPRYQFILLDCDGQSAIDKLFELLPDPDDQAQLTNTVISTSGKDGYCLYWLAVSDKQRDKLKATKGSKTVLYSDKGEKIEIMFGDGHQCVIPPSKHPKTEGYYFINSPDDCYIKSAPDELVDLICNNKKTAKPTKPTDTNKNYTNERNKLCNDIIKAVGDNWLDLIYSLTDHDFDSDSNSRVRGYCSKPNCKHDNDKSNGGAFKVTTDPNSDYYGKFTCYGCESIVGDIVEYEYFSQCSEDISEIKLDTSNYQYFAKRLVERLGLSDEFETQINELGGKPNSDSFDIDDFSGCVEELVLEKLEDDAIIVTNGDFYQYIGTHWQKLEGQCIKKKISDYLRKTYKMVNKGTSENPHYVPQYKFSTYNKLNSAFKFALANLTLIGLPYNNHLISFNNGTLNLSTGQLQLHNKDDYLFSHLPYDYNPEDNNPQVFLDWIYETFGEAQSRKLQAFIRYVIDSEITPDSMGGGKFLHVMGKSGSGKGTLLRLIKKFFAPENVAILSSLSVLNEEKSRHRYMAGKRFAYIADAEKFQKSLESFYEFVDFGGVTAVPLYSNDSYVMDTQCKFAIASIDQLQIENAGRGWSRRCVPITTLGMPTEKEGGLEQKLASEIGQICSWAMQLSRKEVKRILCSEKTTQQQELENDQLISSDSVASFVNACLCPDSSDDVTMESVELWQDYYLPYCEAMNLKPKGKDTFISALKNTLPSDYYVPRKQMRNGHGKQNIPAHWKGIYINQNAFELVTKTNKYDDDEDRGYKFNPKLAWDFGLESFETNTPIDFYTVQGEYKIEDKGNDNKDSTNDGDDFLFKYDFSKYQPNNRNPNPQYPFEEIKDMFEKNKDDFEELEIIRFQLDADNVAGDINKIMKWKKAVFIPQWQKAKKKHQ